MNKLTDNSPMPWGEHKGVAMANVPASYLLWCYKNNKLDKQVKEYIVDNLDILKKEEKDSFSSHNKKYFNKNDEENE